MDNNFNPDSKVLKDKIINLSGESGGMLVGNRHSKNGIKAINKSTGRIIEMEGGEVVITRDAVSDPTKKEFDGELLTNRQILSKINESGGGVSFAEYGAELPTEINCCGNDYQFGGRTQTDFEIIESIYNTPSELPEDSIERFSLSIYNFVETLCNDLEADGTSKLLSYYLDSNKHPHVVKTGKLICNNSKSELYPHTWLEINVNGEIYILDFKSHLWVEPSPYGIINKERAKENYQYIGEEIKICPTDKMILHHAQTNNK